MLHSQLSRKLGLALAAAGLLAIAGCSNQPATEATNQPTSQPASQPAKSAPVKKAAAPKAAAPKTATPKVVPASAKVTQPSQVITVPKGTEITATMGQTLGSSKNHAGDTFAATLSTPIKVAGKTVIPKGAKVTGKVVAVKNHELKVTLASVVVRGKPYDLATNSLRPSDKIQTKSNASANADKASEKGGEQKKDNSTLSAKSQLKFKLAKPLAVPVKG